MDPRSEPMKARANELSHEIIGAAMEVHRFLGPGMLESAYQECLERELELRGIPFVPQLPVKLDYKGRVVECAYKLDFLVDDLLVVEIKSVASLMPVHEAQLSTYLRFTDRWLGLLINFNVCLLKDAIKRRVN